MGSHTPWADKGSVGSIARDLAQLVSSLWRMWTTMRLATDESTLGLLRFSHFQFLLSGLSIHCTCSLHMVLLAQADSAYKDT